jgi:hypothetical protein
MKAVVGPSAGPTLLLDPPSTFEASPWISTHIAAVGSAIAPPEGGGHAELLRDSDTSSRNHSVEQRISGAATRNYSWTVYLKAGARTQGDLYLSSAPLRRRSVLGSIINSGASGTATLVSSSMRAIGNTRWYRVNVRGIPRGVTGST